MVFGTSIPVSGYGRDFDRRGVGFDVGTWGFPGWSAAKDFAGAESVASAARSMFSDSLESRVTSLATWSIGRPSIFDVRIGMLSEQRSGWFRIFKSPYRSAKGALL